ncbi:hypothetical protein CDL15_Pgr013132 [Punica granatum]|nr:hypothetical protein CDL15_Pgr013132 [Punica granatum]
MSSLRGLNCSADFTQNLRERRLDFLSSTSAKVPLLEPRICFPARDPLRLNRQNSSLRKPRTVVEAVSSTDIR